MPRILLRVDGPSKKTRQDCHRLEQKPDSLSLQQIPTAHFVSYTSTLDNKFSELSTSNAKEFSLPSV
jgi:hypothetical protein